MTFLINLLFYNAIMNYNVWSLKRFVHRIARLVPAKASIVDVGAGESPYKSLFSAAKYTSTDWAGTTDHHQYAAGIDVICPADNMPFSNESFDFALCTQVLEHVRYPEKVIQEIGRILKPGGMLFISAPQTWQEHEQPHDYHRFTRFAFRAYAEDNNFEVVEITPQGGRFRAIGYLMVWSLPYVFKSYFGRAGFVGAALFFYPINFLIALIFALLDPLDREKELTLTYECIFRKKDSR